MNFSWRWLFLFPGEKNSIGNLPRREKWPLKPGAFFYQVDTNGSRCVCTGCSSFPIASSHVIHNWWEEEEEEEEDFGFWIFWFYLYSSYISPPLSFPSILFHPVGVFTFFFNKVRGRCSLCYVCITPAGRENGEASFTSSLRNMHAHKRPEKYTHTAEQSRDFWP